MLHDIKVVAGTGGKSTLRLEGGMSSTESDTG